MRKEKFIFTRICHVSVEPVVESYGLPSCNGRQSGGRLHPDCVPRVVSCRGRCHRMTGRIAVGNFRLRRTRTVLRPTFTKFRLAKLTYWVAPSRQPRKRYIAHFKISFGCSAIAIRNSPSKSALSSDGIAFSSERTSTTTLQRLHRCASCAPAPDSFP